MNKRIQELYKKAKQELAAAKPISVLSMPTIIPQEEFNEKFAELILKECFKIIEATTAESIDLGRTLAENASWVKNDIKHSFEVKE